jgi:hypothetical protein
MVSARSRRLRTIGVLLLIAILGMSIYGVRVVIPSHYRARLTYSQTAAGGENRAANPPAAPANQTAANAAASDHSRKALLAHTIFAELYFLVLLILVIFMLIVAWLDVREVMRNYMNQRRSLWGEAAKRARKDAPLPDSSSDES